MIRTDIHTPSSIDPAAYSYERSILTRVPADMEMDAKILMEEIRENLAWLAVEGWQGGNFAAKRTCDHCGAHFVYGAAFRHHDTNQVIVVGRECAQNTMSVDSKAELAHQRLVSRVHSMRAEIQARTAIQARMTALLALYPDMVAVLATDHRIVRDIAARFESTGQLTEKQMALVRKLHTESLQPAKAEPAWKPVTEGRRTVEGVILATKLQESLYGSTLKMLVHLDGDEKVWGSVPSALQASDQPLKGARVRFTATFERSRDDALFGFYKRPSKASRV